MKSHNAERILPKLSVVTVCSKDASGLLKTIKNVREQTYENIELVVVDDSRCAETRSVLDSQCGQKLIWVSEPDAGIYDAMNKGVRLSKSSDWVIFMNAGDTFYDEHVTQEIFGRDQTYDGVEIIFGKAVSYYGNKFALRYEDFRSEEPRFYLKKLPSHQACFIRLSTCKRFPYDTSFKYVADTIFLRQCFRSVAYQEVPSIISFFGLGGSSNWYSSFRHYYDIMFESVKISEFPLIPLMNHTIKFVAQRVLGRKIYYYLYLHFVLNRS